MLKTASLRYPECMADEWQGLVYVRDGAIKLGIVTRPSGTGAWIAERYTFSGLELLGNQYASAEDAQRAVERMCRPK
jgi:hypothetical protein